MTMKQKYEALKSTMDRAVALKRALALFEWDNETLAPEAAGEQTAKIIGSLSGEYYRILTDPKVEELAGECAEAGERDMAGKRAEADQNTEAGGLGQAQRACLKALQKEIRQLAPIPREEYEANARLTARAGAIWAEARRKNDFSMFAPVLKEVLGYQKRFASLQARKGQKLYDVMLDQYEEGFDMESLDCFFEMLKKELVPFLQRVAQKGEQPDVSFLSGGYSLEGQEKLAKLAAEYLGFDFRRGVLAVSAHPFTTNLHNKDVRITTHYKERMDSSLFSVIHETGHALYEMGIRDDLTLTMVGEGAGMGIHESQSRFFENIIGRSQDFWTPLYPKVQDMFPERLKHVSLEQFVRAVNRAEPGFIRTEADELSYSLHILVRYELEKALVEEDMPVELLPEKWAESYETYLGIRPKTDAEGVLQDIHWSQGSFGYFPSYALGSAFAAQIYEGMKRTMDVGGQLRAGNLKAVTDYLRERIHQYGAMKNGRELLVQASGEDFDPRYYISYLKEKYGKLYDLR